MKTRKSFLYIVLAIVLASTLFWAGTVYATTGCFTDTNGHWAETYICWMKDNGITSGTAPGIYSPEGNVTRAQMAVFFQKLYQLGTAYTDNALSTGVTYIGAGNSAWQPNGASTSHYIQYYTDVARLRSSATGTFGYQITASLPDSLFNHLMFLNGVQLCYDAANANASVTSVHLQHWQGGANPTIYKEVVDNTTRNDTVCRTYSVTTPGSLWGSDHVVLYVTVNFATTGGYVDMASTTFILAPSSFAGHAINPPDVREPDSLELPAGTSNGE